MFLEVEKFYIGPMSIVIFQSSLLKQESTFTYIYYISK